jgi:Domain of unknown function (DUF5666)
MAMHKWTWSLTAAALLGLAAGCTKGGTENTQDKGVVARERDRMGQDDRIIEQSPEITGGEDLADQEIYGTVTGVAGSSFTVQNKDGTKMTLALGEDTHFVSRGQQADRNQLQEGTQVRASYDELHGKYEATTVELFPKASNPQQK